MPLRATLRELLQQQGGDSSAFDAWLQQAAEWEGYYKRDKEAAPLLVHLLKTGVWLLHVRFDSWYAVWFAI
jgi:hypothetical protein